MLDVKTFYSVPNWLEVEGRRLPVIVSGRKLARWHCGEIGYLFAVCPGKKASKKPDQKLVTLPPVVSNTEKEAPVVSHTSAGIKKNPLSLRLLRLNIEESGAEWLTVGKGGRKLQPADPHSRKLTQVDTNSPPPSQPKSNISSSPSAKSYAQKTSSPKPKYPPKTPPKQPTPPKVRSFSPGREKFEKLLDLKKRLDQERKSSPRPEPPHSTPSFPRQPRTIRPPSTPPQRSMLPPLMTILIPKKRTPLRCR